jgi:hypothetical protein
MAAPPASPDPFDVGKLATELADIKEQVQEINQDLGRMPGKNGFDDPGAGALKMLSDIRSASRGAAKRHAAWAAGAATAIVTIVKIAEGLGFMPAPRLPVVERPAIAAPAPAR